GFSHALHLQEDSAGHDGNQRDDGNIGVPEAARELAHSGGSLSASCSPSKGSSASCSKRRLRDGAYAHHTTPPNAAIATIVSRLLSRLMSMFVLVARPPASASLLLPDGGAQHLQIGDQCVYLGPVLQLAAGLRDVLVRIRNAYYAQRAHLCLDVLCIRAIAREPWVAGHVRLGNHAARVEEVQPVPVVAVAPAHAMQIGAGALGAPLERVVVDEFSGDGVVPVALHLGAERPHHLR